MSDAPTVRIERVPAAAVRPLRAEVLRPGVPPEKLVYDGDETPDALHLAAVAEGGPILGIASLCREAAAAHPDVEGWRLRGMATLPEARGHGLGARLLRACFGHVRAHGGGLLWCNARVVALGFYEHLGLRREGALFEIAGIGPHYVMSRRLALLRPAQPEEAPLLGALALRSKASWGYDAGFLARCAPALEVTPQMIEAEDGFCVVAEIGGRVLGFHRLRRQDDGSMRLEALFVEPDQVRGGLGRELLEHALAAAALCGADRVETVADPHATGFYARFGFAPQGEVVSEVDPARRLLLMVHRLP